MRVRHKGGRSEKNDGGSRIRAQPLGVRRAWKLNCPSSRAFCALMDRAASEKSELERRKCELEPGEICLAFIYTC